jgi:hypothetical protein
MEIKMFTKTQTYLLMAILTVAVLAMSGCGKSITNPVSSPPASAKGDIVIKVASDDGLSIKQTNQQPYVAGYRAAKKLKGRMGNIPIHAVIIAEYFEDKSAKSKALDGVCSVFDRSIVYGFASYGSFGQDGCSDNDTVRIIGIGGAGIQVTAALEKKLGVSKLTIEDDLEELQKRLQEAGSSISAKLPKTDDSQLMILIPDAHSPKNAFVVEGAQEVLGKDFPITGGSANKNPGQTYVYYQGQMYTDSAIAFMLSGDFKVSLTGRKAKENSKVISSAGEGFAEAIANLDAQPIAAFAFNCAGRKGKLDNLEDELAAIQKEFGKSTPIFGTYCAGEIGPADVAVKPGGVLSSGNGWHLMVTVIGKEPKPQQK